MDEHEHNEQVHDSKEEVEPTIIAPENHPIREESIDVDALKVLYRLRDAGFKGYLVGGGVRDLYLGRTPKDFDISTDARPGQLRKLFRNSRTIGRRFRLVQVFFRGNKIIEVSTLRSRSEFDMDDPNKVLPHNNTFGTLEEDAFRRDLTINSLFYEVESHSIIDYVDGVKDLQDRLVRVVGDPDRRFTRDPVRMMRAIRHAARTGFTIDEQTLIGIREHRDKLDLCPPSRLRDEVLKDLHSGAAAPWAKLCLSSGIFEVLFSQYQSDSIEEHQLCTEELIQQLAVVDQLFPVNGEEGEKAKVPDHLLFALLLLPWACRRFDLFTVNLRGGGYQHLLKDIRAELGRTFSQRFNIKRMLKEAMTTLLVNFPTFHQYYGGSVKEKTGKSNKRMPKWLKKKSYYRDCLLFYKLFHAAQYQQPVPKEVLDAFVPKEKGVSPLRVAPAVQKMQQEIPQPSTATITDSSVDTLAGEKESTPAHEPDTESSTKAASSRGTQGRGGANPAFCSKKGGVFGLREGGSVFMPEQ